MRAFRVQVGVLFGVCFSIGWGAWANSCLAQGGQGGGGRGFGGAAMGSSMETSDTFSKDHILSPGDAADWPFQAREGETMVFSITSRNFDPTVEIVGADGKVLAQNDDIRRGQQDALLLYHFPKGGKYTALVKAAKSGAGGGYVFTVRRFVAMETPIGVRTAGSLRGTGYQWHRFAVTAGQTIVTTVRATDTLSLELIAPNGEEVEDTTDTRSRVAQGQVFRAAVTGNYYLRVARRNFAGDSYALTVAAARLFPTTIGQNPPAKRLEVGGLDLWNFQGTAGDLVHIRAKAVGGEVATTLEYLPPEAKDDEPRTPEPSSAPLVRLQNDPKVRNEVVALLNRTGNYQVSIMQPLGHESEYTLSVSRMAKPIPAQGEIEGKLPLGGSDYWTLEGKAGEILRWEGKSEQFDAVLTLYDPKGEVLATNDDGGEERNALLTAALVTTGRYLLRVQAFGNGGSGTYRVRRVANPVRTLAFGKREQGRVGAESSEVWSFKGKAGQVVIISVRSSDFDTRISVRGPDGVEMDNNDDGGDGTNSLLSVRLPLEGVYTLWVFAKQGGGQYVVQMMDAP